MELATIIRCKDCKHCHIHKNGCNSDCDLHYGMTNPNGFCSDAEPKSSNQLRTFSVNGSLPLPFGVTRGKMKEEGHQ